VKAAPLVLLCAGCAIPAVSAGTFLPAGELRPHDFEASLSLESGRVLAGPADVHDLVAVPTEAQRYEVSTWVASDATLRWQADNRIAFEVQAKLTDPVSPFVPNLVGGAIGTRLRLLDHVADNSLSMELGTRAVFVSADQRIERSSGNRTQVDEWSYRAIGVEVPLITTYRVSDLFSITAAPFLRTYWIRVDHDKTLLLQASDGSVVAEPSPRASLQWTPVLSAGLGIAAELDFGPIQLSPAVAAELATRPGPGMPTKLLIEPGISVGTHF
jgi:hypothetical protein